MKNRISKVKAWLFATALVVFGIGFRVAGATPPYNQFQAPTCWYQSGSVVGCVYEDGGTTWTTAGQKGTFDPLTGGITNVTRSLAVDGGTTLKNVGASALTLTSSLAVDGGAVVQNSLNLGSGDLSVSAGNESITGAINVSAAGGFDGGVTALGGKTVPVFSTSAAAGDNSIQCYVGAVGTAITFSPAFASGTPHGFCNDLTASQFCRTTATNTTGTITGTGTDSVYVCYVGIK